MIVQSCYADNDLNFPYGNNEVDSSPTVGLQSNLENTLAGGNYATCSNQNARPTISPFPPKTHP